MAKSKAKLHVASQFNVDQLNEPPLFASNPEAALPLLSMIGQAQLSIDDLRGQLSRRIADIVVCNVSIRKYARVVHPLRR